MNSARRRRPYRRKEHWNESIWFWASVWMLIGWFVIYEGLDFAKQLGLLP